MIKEIILVVISAYVLVALYFGILKKNRPFKFIKKFFKVIIIFVIIVAVVYGFMVLR